MTKSKLEIIQEALAECNEALNACKNYTFKSFLCNATREELVKHILKQEEEKKKLLKVVRELGELKQLF